MVSDLSKSSLISSVSSDGEEKIRYSVVDDDSLTKISDHDRNHLFNKKARPSQFKNLIPVQPLRSQNNSPRNKNSDSKKNIHSKNNNNNNSPIKEISSPLNDSGKKGTKSKF